MQEACILCSRWEGATEVGMKAQRMEFDRTKKNVRSGKRFTKSMRRLEKVHTENTFWTGKLHTQKNVYPHREFPAVSAAHHIYKLSSDRLLISGVYPHKQIYRMYLLIAVHRYAGDVTD